MRKLKDEFIKENFTLSKTAYFQIISKKRFWPFFFDVCFSSICLLLILFLFTNLGYGFNKNLDNFWVKVGFAFLIMLFIVSLGFTAYRLIQFNNAIQVTNFFKKNKDLLPSRHQENYRAIKLYLKTGKYFLTKSTWKECITKLEIIEPKKAEFGSASLWDITLDGENIFAMIVVIIFLSLFGSIVFLVKFLWNYFLENKIKFKSDPVVINNFIKMAQEIWEFNPEKDRYLFFQIPPRISRDAYKKELKENKKIENHSNPKKT